LDRIHSARNSTYQLIQSYNVDTETITKNISKIIEIFTQTTNGFETESCLKLKEEQMGRFTTDNCYAQISSRIKYGLNGKYEIAVGEKAYFVTDYFQNDISSIVYEFFLGPLYFGVYETKCR
jgi:hypothetical protein